MVCEKCKGRGTAWRRVIDNNGRLQVVTSYDAPPPGHRPKDWQVVPCPHCQPPDEAEPQ